MRCKKKLEHRHSDVDNYVYIHINAMPKVLGMLLKLSNIVIVHLYYKNLSDGYGPDSAKYQTATIKGNQKSRQQI